MGDGFAQWTIRLWGGLGLEYTRMHSFWPMSVTRSVHGVLVGGPFLASLAPNHVEEEGLIMACVSVGDPLLYSHTSSLVVSDDLDHLGKELVGPHLALT